MRAVIVAAMTAAACGSGQSNAVKLQGKLISAGTAPQSEPLLLAMGWYPTFAGTSPGSPVGAVITQANIQYQGNFPVDFSFNLTGTPPPAAQFDLSTTGGKGHLAYGVLIAFRDVNGNGKFDENSAGHADADVIAGLSVPDPSRPPPEQSWFVVWLDGQPAASDYYSAFALQQGYNLMEIHYDFGIEPLPLSTSLSIPITFDPALNIYACQAAFQSLDWFKRSCGIDPYGGTWQAQGSVFSESGGSYSVLNVLDGDGVVTNASIALDGQPYQFDGQWTYSLSTAGPLTGTHTMTLSVPNRASETLVLAMPGQISVTAPSQAKSGSPVSISWNAASGTAYYDVYFLADDGSNAWLFHTITHETQVTTPPISYVGPARLSVKAIAPLAVGSQGSFVNPISQDRATVTFVH